MTVDPGLCACGSGLRTVRCCGLDPANLPPPGAARVLAPMVERASELYNQNNSQDAVALVLEVLELAPAHPEGLTL